MNKSETDKDILPANNTMNKYESNVGHLGYDYRQKVCLAEDDCMECIVRKFEVYIPSRSSVSRSFDGNENES